MTDARTLTAALGGRWSGRSGSARCPAHADNRPSLSLSDAADGRLLWHCHAGCDPLDVLAALKRRGLLGSGRDAGADPTVERERQRAERIGRERAIRRAQMTWAEAQPVAGTLAERYLRARACDYGKIFVPSQARARTAYESATHARTVQHVPPLRFHPRCWHPTALRLPAMLAAVTVGQEVVAIHRTYLAEPGKKATVEPQKAMLGPVMGGAVRLAAGAGPLVVAEGIETSLSVAMALSDASPRVWAALSAGGMAALRLPEEQPGELAIAPDGDAAGRSAAAELARRAHGLGWRVRVMEPPTGGRDWNDVAMEAAHEHA